MLQQSRLKDLLDYDPETGVFRWKVSRGGMAAGALAGRLNKDYLEITVDGRSYQSHRLAWLYVFGLWPSDELDHTNMVKHDNRIANLRDATRGQNKTNGKRYCTNTSGFKGVSFHKKRNKFRAYIYTNYKHNHLGYFLTAQEAADVAYQAAVKAYGEFARKETQEKPK
jgi:hypothetical protein